MFGITLLATQKLGNWLDLLIVAAWSIIIYYVATNSGLSNEQVQAAVADVEAEAAVEDTELHLAG